MLENQNIPNEEIDTSDIPELGDRFWETAKMVTPTIKQAAFIHSIDSNLCAINESLIISESHSDLFTNYSLLSKYKVH